MACPTIFDAFAVANEHLSKQVYDTPMFEDIILEMIPKSTFPKNVGTTVTDYQIANSEPTDDEPTWTSISVSNGVVSNQCDPTFNAIEVGYDSWDSSPKQYALKGPVLCKDEHYFTHYPDRFLEGYVQAIARNAKRVRANHFLAEYIAMATKVVANAAFTPNNTLTGFNAGTTAPNLTLDAATGQLTKQMLDRVAVELITNGAAETLDSNGYVSMGPNGPLFSLLIGIEAQPLLFKNNAEYRSDIRWGDSSKLMQRVGAMTAIGNFRTVPWLTPPRYYYDGTKYVRVPTWDMNAATKGKKAEFNADYLSAATAPYEGALIMSPAVLEAAVVQPDSTVGSVTWSPHTAMGDWKFVTGSEAFDANSEACFDPLHKKGRHFVQFIEAFRRGKNRRSGMLIIFKRCVEDSYEIICNS